MACTVQDGAGEVRAAVRAALGSEMGSPPSSPLPSLKAKGMQQVLHRRCTLTPECRTRDLLTPEAPQIVGTLVLPMSPD